MRQYPLILILLPLMLAIRLLEPYLLPPLPDTDTPHAYQVVVEDYPKTCEHTFRYPVAILAADTATNMLGQHAYLYLKTDTLLPTDTLQIRACWRSGGMLGEFDYGLYLRRKSLIGSAYVPNRDIRCVTRGQIPWYSSTRLRHRLEQRYQQLGIHSERLSTLSAITLGDKDQLDPAVKQHFQRAGAAHVLAVSGLHTVILFQILWVILTLGGYCKPLYSEPIKRSLLYTTIIVLLWAYAFLTGLSASVLRSVIMLTIVLVGNWLHREPIGLNTLMAAAIIVLLIRPLELWSVGFWMSFLAVGSLLWMGRSTGHKLTDLLLTTLIAQLGVMPLSLYCFGQVSNYFLLSSLLVIVLAEAIMWSAVLTLTLGWIPLIGEGLGRWLNLLMDGMLRWVAWVDSLPGAITTIRCSLPMMLLLYAAILSGALAIKKNLYWLIMTAMCLIAWCILYYYNL